MKEVEKYRSAANAGENKERDERTHSKSEDESSEGTEREKREGSKTVPQAHVMHVGENHKPWKHEEASEHLGF